MKTLDRDELMGRREGEARGAEAERRWQRVAGMVMGRCTQARFQLHAAHMTSCTHGLHTHPCQHQNTLLTRWAFFSTPRHRHTGSGDYLLSFTGSPCPHGPPSPSPSPAPQPSPRSQLVDDQLCPSQPGEESPMHVNVQDLCQLMTHGRHWVRTRE